MYCKVTTDSACVWIIKLSPVTELWLESCDPVEFVGHFLVLETVKLSNSVRYTDATRQVIYDGLYTALNSVSSTTKYTILYI